MVPCCLANSLVWHIHAGCSRAPFSQMNPLNTRCGTPPKRRGTSSRFVLQLQCPCTLVVTSSCLMLSQHIIRRIPTACGQQQPCATHARRRRICTSPTTCTMDCMLSCLIASTSRDIPVNVCTPASPRGVCTSHMPAAGLTDLQPPVVVYASVVCAR